MHILKLISFNNKDMMAALGHFINLPFGQLTKIICNEEKGTN